MASLSSLRGACLHDQGFAAQVREARAEGRAEGRTEGEAAAEQRLAALDQARREEREAAVREALALGARQVSACPARLLPLACVTCAPLQHTGGHATKQPPSMPAASRHGLRRGGACCTLMEALETLIRMRIRRRGAHMAAR